MPLFGRDTGKDPLPHGVAKTDPPPAAYKRPSLPAGRIPHRPYTLSPEDAGWLIEDVWPTVYFGSDRVPEIKRKISTLPWAKQAWDTMRREADMAIATPPQVPVEACGWRHDFYSRQTANALLYEPDQPKNFLDPSTGKRESDEKQRAAWVLLTHERTFRMMCSLGLLYQITGDEKYAAWAAEGMRRAADYFTHHEFWKKTAQGPTLYYQFLYDAGIVLLLANAYELTMASRAYTDADHAHIRRDIFEERVPNLVQFLIKGPQVHNMACFASAAVASAGRVMKRNDWVERGLGAQTGLRTQLMGGIETGPGGKLDGFWHEGTLFYHYYSLCTLTTLYELERQARDKVDPELTRRFAAMFDAPVQMADQQLRLPPVGDLSAPRTVDLAVYRHLYEYAAGQIDAERFGPVVAAIYENGRMPRTDWTALAYGIDTLPRPGGIPAKSTLLPVTGTGVFRASTPEPFYVLFRCGRDHGGHDHPDRLSILLHAHGQPISPDLGTAGYSLHPLNGNYYRSTMAHNTLFANEGNQIGSATLDWRPDASPNPQARGIVNHDGITYTRTVHFAPPYIVLVDEYASDKAQRYCWAYHAYGDLTAETDMSGGSPPNLGLSPLPANKTWDNLTQRRTLAVPALLSARWQVAPNLRLRLLTRSDTPFEATAARSIGQPYADTQGALIYRAPSALKRHFVTVLEVHPASKEATLADITMEADGATVKLKDGTARSFLWRA